MENESENIARIELTRGCFAIVDAEDFPYLSRYKWRYSNGYAMSSDLLMHRFIMAAPKGSVVDHINSNRLDNRKINLRICTHQQNSWNRPKAKGRSQYRGVHWVESVSKWGAEVRINGKRKNFGYFVLEIDAAKAFDKAMRESRGDFAQLNFPDESESPYANQIPNPARRHDCKSDFFDEDGSILIECTQGIFCRIDADDYDLVKNHYWVIQILRGRALYARTAVYRNGIRTTVAMHRMLMNPPDNQVIDHIDGNKQNNKRSNLRICSVSDNGKNVKIRKQNISGFRGVYPSKPRGWCARITINGKNTHLGMSQSKEVCAKLYDDAARLHFGEFANLNFPV